ncbi:LacI family transcriptional regulator [Silvimonas terrae]|uniref:LacI family transcriptional regulator n=1 Tax=Silvimonas terrae TaxID=300266 RepID=A0A840R844_9NEIS|nr:LacI family DNA-binding transcriptional regulator [Silvimonas terrae]MBB5189465.1 LacI family transcriptional regulator [Silvimonas terrae]
MASPTRKTEKLPQRRPTMTDIAKSAGVSQSTVSLVLNNNVGSAKLSDKTRAKVLKIAAELGYRLTHRTTAAPQRGRNMIGYIVDSISTSPHPVVSVDGARDAAWEHDCVLSVFATRGDPEVEEATINALLANPTLVGVVYSTIFTRKVEVPEALKRVPTVLLNCYTDERNFSHVEPGEVGGGHNATEYLINAGHTRIGFINGEPWMDAAKDRFKGYRQALATADLPFDPRLVRDGDWMSGTGFEQTLSLMAEPRPPTAIFCANDLMALGALEALKQLGLKAPDDVAIMGYDDQEIARHTHPPLTTVLLPNYEMGRWAVDTLIAEAASPEDAATQGAQRKRHIKMECPLVVRESVACPQSDHA